jgi:hypothetical protein
VKTMKTSYVVFLATFLAGTSAFAHHSAVMFDFGPDKQKQIEGVVKEFQWTNPHTFIVLAVKNEAGETEEWGFEGMSPNWLGRHGWSKRTLEPGAEIAMGFAPLKDGRKGGFTLTVHLPDGTVLQELPAQSELPAQTDPPAPSDAPRQTDR